jgi:hypothetical protein
MARSRVNSKSSTLQHICPSEHTNKHITTWARAKTTDEQTENPYALPEHHIHINACCEAWEKVDRVRNVLLPVADVLLVLVLRITSQNYYHTDQCHIQKLILI